MLYNGCGSSLAAIYISLRFAGIMAILTSVHISNVTADGRRVNSQKFDKVFTNQTVEDYSRHVVRSVAECTSICISDKLVECKAFSLRESLSSSRECLLYNTTVDSPASNQSSALSSSVYMKRGSGMTSGSILGPSITTPSAVVVTDSRCRLPPGHPSFHPELCPGWLDGVTDDGI